MLRANHRVLRQGGRVGFWTIHPTAGISARDRRRANEIGPPGCGLRSPHENLLTSAGFVDIDAVDASQEYAATIRGWLAAWAAREKRVRAAIGDAEHDRRVTNRTAALAAVEEGILSRTMYVARRPDARQRWRCTETA